MIEKMTDYFAAEKHESLLFMVVGLVMVGVAVWLVMNGHRLKSMAYPLVAIALIQLVVGASVYFRTDNQIAHLRGQATTAPARFKAEEIARMDAVMKSFVAYKWIEIALLVLGICLIAIWARNDVAAGVGAGLVLQAAIMLCLDLFAEARGEDYLLSLRALLG